MSKQVTITGKSRKEEEHPRAARNKTEHLTEMTATEKEVIAAKATARVYHEGEVLGDDS